MSVAKWFVLPITLLVRHGGGSSTSDDLFAGENIQALIAADQNLYASTMDNGLLVATNSTTRRFLNELSDPRPRSLVQFQDALYVQLANGMVDRIKDFTIDKDVCKSLARKGVYSLSTNGTKLFAGQWGGWSEFDGAKWVSHFDAPELHGYVVTVLLPARDKLYIGTQGGGLGQYSVNERSFKWTDRGLLLEDDWVTCLATDGNQIWIGTFVGGLSRVSKGVLKHFEELRGQNVTSLVCLEGKTYVGTRFGLFVVETEKIRAVAKFENENVQALTIFGSQLIVGTRSGITRLDLLPPASPKS